ncbi:TetR/AcrR family transcriptional regulator [Geopsychrobacter electrodiphilus]|uniref:TetR/AcrR family transcriptional regulator n=1 Tax=Geopsychrobacter electrodiphilus TaxID=225196 RepID=UPI000371BF8B|nr:TetR/AcrR family transcriptional regulator [Geopsychrobacter electrodiphilus]
MTIEEVDKCHAVTQAALELIAVQGFHGTPISQIAKLAGVSVGSIYRYFADKDALIHAIHTQVEEKMHDALTTQLSVNLANRELFMQLIKTLVLHLYTNPLEFKFIEQYYNSPFGVEKMRKKFLEDADPCLCSDQDKPFFDLLCEERGKTIKNLPVSMIHALAFGPMIFLVRDLHSGFVALNDDLLQQFAASCWDAIKL